MQGIKTQIETMGTFVSEYENQMRTKFSLEEQQQVLNSEKAKHEIKAKEEVTYAVDEETGKKKYTNEEMRNIAMSKSLETNEDYNKIRLAVEKLEKEISKSKLELDILHRRLSVMSKQSDLLVALTNFKANEVAK